MQIIYDGTFEGFLCLVYEVYYKKLKPTSIRKQKCETLLFEDIYEIKTDELNAKKVLDSLKLKFPKKPYCMILNLFFCDYVDFEMDLLRFIIIGFKDTKELFNINNSFVSKLLKYEKELFYTVHKMSGFARFVELEDGTLYAKIESKHNIVYFLGKHFFKRFNNQKYIIHDIKRKIVFIKNDEFIGIKDIASFEEPKISQKEGHFAKLWCEFFEAVSIKQRENKKCQQSFVPLLFRTYMTEFNQ